MSEEKPITQKELMLTLRGQFGVRKSLQILNRVRKRLTQEAKVRGRESPMTEAEFLRIVDEESTAFVKEIAE